MVRFERYTLRKKKLCQIWCNLAFFPWKDAMQQQKSALMDVLMAWQVKCEPFLPVFQDQFCNLMSRFCTNVKKPRLDRCYFRGSMHSTRKSSGRGEEIVSFWIYDFLNVSDHFGHSWISKITIENSFEKSYKYILDFFFIISTFDRYTSMYFF